MSGAETVLGEGAGSAKEREKFWQALPELALGKPGEREALASRWLAAARAEHASIASFSVFSLDLLECGAPARLVKQAHEAALDEVEHARICFALASHYAGKKLGPGPLSSRSVKRHASIARIVCATIEEGCVGETLVAAEAEWAASRARDDAVRFALEVIARDETRHGQLAWEFVSWALRSCGASLWEESELAFFAAVKAARLPRAAKIQASLLEAHGELSDATRIRVRAGVLDQAIVPAWEELRKARDG